MRRSGRGVPSPMRRAMDQIRRLAPSISPPMLPVVSSTKATSTRGAAAGRAGAARAVEARTAASRADGMAFIPPGPGTPNPTPAFRLVIEFLKAEDSPMRRLAFLGVVALV